MSLKRYDTKEDFEGFRQSLEINPEQGQYFKADEVEAEIRALAGTFGSEIRERILRYFNLENPS